MFGWSSMGNGTKAAVGAAVGIVLIILATLFANGRVDPVEVATLPQDPAPTTSDAESVTPAPDTQEQAVASATETAAEPEPEQVAETPEASAPASDDPEEQPQQDEASVPQQAEAAPAESATDSEEVEQPDPPVFDVVRVEADGTALIAGRGEPGATVTLLLNGKEIAEESVDAGGNFVAFTSLPGSAQAQSLSIRMSTSGTGAVVMSSQTVMIAPSVRSQPTVLAEVASTQGAPEVESEAAVPETNGDGAENAVASVGGLAVPADADSASDLASAASDVSSRPAPATSLNVASAPGLDQVPEIGSAPTSAEPAQETVTETVAALPEQEDQKVPEADTQAPKILIADNDGVRVLQDGGKGPEVLDVIALDTISYDDQGDVTLAGRGTGTGFVRVYINNEPIKTLEIAANGQWNAPLPEVDTGIYTLRIDELDEAGDVVSRVETPFKKEEPEVLATAMAQQDSAGGGVRVMTVQKGDTLWDISESNYGQGILYVRVFEANRDRIRDPHWIYPGQVFTLPDRGQ